ncbi:MAG: guanine-specific ribonuclease N1 and T1 [Betaproteobacteria bacterium]|jgi:ribonuclease T1|nr:guanine-specific ribonuclease N1 and T1 [Betaproteobacteria bacterium]NBS45990.1 guanine-specific ribonuclease N1 and T1 [Betaproteobacteria bacterium]
MRWRLANGLLKFALTGLVFLASLSGEVSAKEPPAAPVAAVIRLEALPVEGRETMTRIRLGGPFPYEKDGTVFGNRERLLAPMPRGHYREYTVPTPGARDRGARRIVCGGPPKAPDACYYTADHYASFRRIVE